ncbi:hypothetical protein BO79DRAFT_222193 [Aspergillus costaricaensis CBS 115574]|uniref:Uncharacterized protein n=1 Tax=Aspergillus costaricaensis CBS 115574 TaxID=1448317 RepID=A0ACD1I1J0_9EURO|nr:hypothetical protein BO79DRAFT_222193 [Aspergillus costaricaensis CBS 115574]RAK83860.1 hypothetical protein BO79DRAFT_222193 [Aspergillus costaricaensis CBS 115574]
MGRYGTANRIWSIWQKKDTRLIEIMSVYLRAAPVFLIQEGAHVVEQRSMWNFRSQSTPERPEGQSQVLGYEWVSLASYWLGSGYQTRVPRVPKMTLIPWTYIVCQVDRKVCDGVSERGNYYQEWVNVDLEIQLCYSVPYVVHINLIQKLE